MKKLEFGYKVKDIVTGFEGILCERTIHITGCDNYCIASQEKDEKRYYSDTTVKYIDDGIIKELEEIGKANKFDDIENALYKFGQKVKDKVSGFTGIIIAINISITGDICYNVAPRFNLTSRENNGRWYDEGRLEIIEDKKINVNTDKKRVGGITPTMKCY